jgi:hypothetical protein
MLNHRLAADINKGLTRKSARMVTGGDDSGYGHKKALTPAFLKP